MNAEADEILSSVFCAYGFLNIVEKLFDVDTFLCARYCRYFLLKWTSSLIFFLFFSV